MLYDMIIVGGGCAGLAASIYARRYNMEVLLLSESLGGTITTTHLVENYPGFTSVTGQELADHIINHANANNVQMKIGSRTSKIIKEGEIFKVTSGKETFEARTVLLATGTTYRKLGIPGEQEFSARGVSYCATCDAPFYKGKSVMMIGGGDSAVKESLVLASHAKDVTIVYRGEKLRPEPINLKRMEATPNIKVLYKTQLTEIMGEQSVTKVKLDNGTEMPTQGVFVEIGRIPLTSMVDELGVAKNEKGEILIDVMSKTNVPGFYAAGDVTDTEWKQAIVGVAEGVKAAYMAFEYVSAQKLTN